MNKNSAPRDERGGSAGAAAVPPAAAPLDRADLKPSESRCARCGGIFEKGWYQEKAAQEYHEEFPDVLPLDLELVCDDCFHALGFGDTREGSE